MPSLLEAPPNTFRTTDEWLSARQKIEIPVRMGKIPVAGTISQRNTGLIALRDAHSGIISQQNMTAKTIQKRRTRFEVICLS